MARILDALHPSPHRGHEKDQPATHLPLPVADEPEDSGVPFIEVGGPVTQSYAKPRATVPIPTILPLTRPAQPLETPKIETDPLPLYRISFQPLPFPTRPDRPLTPARELIAFHQPAHPLSEQYRALLAAIESQLGAESNKAILFTSGLAGAGTTSVLLNLAVTTAQREGTQVVAVDANLARPVAADRLATAPAPGLGEVLARTVPLAWGLHETGQPNLRLLPAGQRLGEPSMDLWPLVLDQLRQRFDWVMIDAAEWGRPELAALAGTATATYLVIRQTDLEAPELADLLTDIPKSGVHLRGYVLVAKE